MVHDVFSGPWGRALIIVVAALAVVVLLLVIACFLVPGCLGYKCIRRRSKLQLRIAVCSYRQAANTCFPLSRGFEGIRQACVIHWNYQIKTI